MHVDKLTTPGSTCLPKSYTASTTAVYTSRQVEMFESSHFHKTWCASEERSVAARSVKKSANDYNNNRSRILDNDSSWFMFHSWSTTLPMFASSSMLFLSFFRYDPTYFGTSPSSAPHVRREAGQQTVYFWQFPSSHPWSFYIVG